MAFAAKRKLPAIFQEYILTSDCPQQGIFKAKRKHCSLEISGRMGVTTNFIRHVKAI